MNDSGNLVNPRASQKKEGILLTRNLCFSFFFIYHISAQILCWNCRVASNSHIVNRIKDFATRLNPHLICLVETKADSSRMQLLQNFPKEMGMGCQHCVKSLRKLQESSETRTNIEEPCIRIGKEKVGFNNREKGRQIGIISEELTKVGGLLNLLSSSPARAIEWSHVLD
ncbi:uncharacterized protein LOC120283735 [Dioscorea cayenensis subsp. rotundata]|uniref:Uncharacterized protein LOC120283735 n=1 Tax=Dioscorea cayennensis subsp. rotundata TaxID=55577 RepID=A0AB40D405_DIOCR|nr:uncharacterized protein LOC120283735 [Dioscorea cayenensis subsp. rotundata]